MVVVLALLLLLLWLLLLGSSALSAWKTRYGYIRFLLLLLLLQPLLSDYDSHPHLELR